jgi:hypothetical protein
MTLRRKIQRRLCTIWWQFRHPLPEDKFTIPVGGLRPKHLVVIFPPEFPDFDVAQGILSPLIAHLAPEKTTLLVRENFRTWLPDNRALKIIPFDTDLKNWLGFPKHAVFKKMQNLEADVVIDLTPGFCPFTAALAAHTGAPLRISFDSDPTNHFYNFFVCTENGKNLADRYDLLLRYV